MTTLEPVIIALEQQVCCYRRLAKLAEAQHECVQRSHTEQLLQILASRQEVLDQVAQFEVTIGPVKRDWARYLAGLSPGPRDKADELMQEARRLLEQITTSDRNDAIVLQQRKLNLGRQISQTNVARTVNRNYAAAAYGPLRPRMDIQQ